ncbi:MAG: DsrE family protein [Anaerolineae bacterium]|nr:DsrE family protein [Anaerolineae bacterium]
MADNETRTVLFIINDGPYGNERAYNALRLALNVVKRPGVSVRVFMTGDGVHCARQGQKTPEGYYNVERMVRSLARRGEVAT